MRNHRLIFALTTALIMAGSFGGKSCAGLASMMFKDGMVHGLLDQDQMLLRSCTGDLYSVEDDTGRVIIPPMYSDIEYCGHGIFLATDVQQRNKYFFGDKRHFFDRKGKELSYKLPAEAYLLNILSFGTEADKNPDSELDKLPYDSVMLFGIRETSFSQWHDDDVLQGLSDLDGRVRLEPIKGEVLFVEPGSAFAYCPGRKSFIINLKTWTSTPTKLLRNPGSFPVPRIPDRFVTKSLPLPKGYQLKVVKTDDGLFDHNHWCERRESPITCLDMYNRFLHEYDLIGMPIVEVRTLLGKPDESKSESSSSTIFSYAIPIYSCTGAGRGVVIHFTNGRVVSWSFFSKDGFGQSGREQGQITTNVVLKRHQGRLALARIGDNLIDTEFEPKKP